MSFKTLAYINLKLLFAKMFLLHGNEGRKIFGLPWLRIFSWRFGGAPGKKKNQRIYEGYSCRLSYIFKASG